MTNGEYRVGIDFNPSKSDRVGQIKRLAADLIDLIESVPNPDYIDQNDGAHLFEVARLKALASTSIEQGAMWAVKAATKGKR